MKKVLYPIVCTVILSVSSAAFAGSTCRFTQLCEETSACEPADLVLDFRAGTGGPLEMELATPTGIVEVSVGGTGTVAHVAGMSGDGFHVLTVQAGTGTARYTYHTNDPEAGPTVKTYLGTCEVNR